METPQIFSVLFLADVLPAHDPVTVMGGLIIIPGTQIGLRSSSEDLSVRVEYFLLVFLRLVRNIETRIKIRIMKMMARMMPEITPMLS